MFWGLTIEPGKHYSQTVDQSFHVSMAALDTREKSGITQLLVRHEKAEFLLCTLQYGDDIPYPYLQQTLNLNLSEGSEISFYSEGKGTIHLTGYLVTDEPIMEDPGLIAEARNLLVGSDDEEDYDSDEEEEEYSDSDMESTSSQDVSCNWQDLINDFEGEDDDDSEEEEWTPESAKKSAKKAVKEKKRKSQDDSISDDMTLSAYKKKRKAAVQAETLSKMEIAADEGGNEEDDEEEEEDGDFNPVLDMEAEESDDEDDDEDDDEEDEEDYEEEEEEEKSKPSPKKKAQTPKGKEGKSPTASPQKASQKMEEAESEEKTESPLKKKKKKKKQQQEEVKEDESKEEVDLPLKNLKTNNKENIEVQKKAKPAKKEQTPAKQKIQKIKLQSGTTIEDLKTGEGKLAKPGKKVFMYYRGVLASNQKEFDSKLSGKPFMFGLGKGEVIKGWDAGIIGMKVGGKRRLTVPPSQAYGSQRIGPIPPNSTLIFDVELKAVR
ncbi:46 kDa FK506-binding nuclear protein-like [Lytechinus variegatus]|uniref:46 kDa FK506-binding nuclear protein-like n=1 Tax=Lytechinus variegatus TaxID=7654 RepID=UPI001BB287B2|nr:46 kDa FK506-binding nuclear protein-like [Lytechinus variegatus]